LISSKGLEAGAQDVPGNEGASGSTGRLESDPIGAMSSKPEEKESVALSA
jgi:hypothetical protein